MTNTRGTKVNFEKIPYRPYKKKSQPNTIETRQKGTEIIKITQKGTDTCTFSEYRNINYAEQKMKEAYRKINKMLGGN